jgi:hypothetical protein
MSIKGRVEEVRGRWPQTKRHIADFFLSRVLFVLGWPRSEVPSRWYELKRELLLDCGLYLAMVVYALAFIPLGRMLAYLLPVALFLAFFRRFTITRWDTTGARAWARWVVAHRLRDLVESIDPIDPSHRARIRKRLSLSTTDVALLKSLRHDDDVQLSTQEHFRRAGSRPSRRLAPLTLTILSAIAFVVGAVLGALLQGDAVVSEVTPLCQTNLSGSSVAFAAFVFLLGGMIAFLPKIAVTKREANLFAKQGAWITANPKVWLSTVSDAYLEVLRTDVWLALTLVRTTREQANAVLTLHNIPVEQEGRGLSIFERTKLSQVNEIAMVQFQMVLGIYLGLTLPFLLKVQC